MDDENSGKPYFLMGDLGVYHDFRNPPIYPHPKTDMTMEHQPFIKIHLLLKMGIFHGHVCFWGCRCLNFACVLG